MIGGPQAEIRVSRRTAGRCQANERASEPTRTERAGEAARERACRGVRGAKPFGVIIEVLEAERRRIHKVRMRLAPQPQPEA